MILTPRSFWPSSKWIWAAFWKARTLVDLEGEVGVVGLDHVSEGLGEGEFVSVDPFSDEVLDLLLLDDGRDEADGLDLVELEVLEEGLVVDLDGLSLAGLGLDGLELLDRGGVSDEFSGGLSGDEGGTTVVSGDEGAVELLDEHVVDGGALELVTSCEGEDEVHEVGDSLEVGLEVWDVLGGVDSGEDDASGLVDGVDTVLFAVSGSDEDGAVGDSDLVEELVGGELVGVEESVLGDHQEESVFG